MKNQAVSVIVPNYNHARYLKRRLDSIVAQTFCDYELIILDDASTDASMETIAPYLRDPRARLLANASNSGSTFAQWNRGVAMASGEFVWLAESDDYAEPGLLEKLVTLLRANPSVGLALCQSYKIDENDAVIGTMEEFTADIDSDHWRQPFISKGREECGRYLLWKNTVPNASAVVFRREVYQRAGGAPTNLRLAGDWLTWARMLLISDQAFIPDLLNYFRHHTQTVRANVVGRDFFDESWIVRRFISRNCRIGKKSLRRLAEVAMAEVYSRILSVPRGQRWGEAWAGFRQFGAWLALHPVATVRSVSSHSPLSRLRFAARELIPGMFGKE